MRATPSAHVKTKAELRAWYREFAGFVPEGYRYRPEVELKAEMEEVCILMEDLEDDVKFLKSQGFMTFAAILEDAVRRLSKAMDSGGKYVDREP